MPRKAAHKGIPDDLRLAPLDEIRQEEARNARRILLARQQAETICQEARHQADQQKQQARGAGLRDGEAASELRIAAAREEAERILAQARVEVELMAALADPHVDAAAGWAERMVLGLESGDAQP